MEVLDQAIAEYGKPEILNSDQTSQFTSKGWISGLEKEHIKSSMDGKDARWTTYTLNDFGVR